MWSSTPDCREVVDTRGALLGERTAALLRGELEGLGPPDLCCIFKVPVDRRLPRLFAGSDDLQEGVETACCQWFRRGWRVVRCLYCSYNALHQQDLRVELSCQGAAPRRVDARLLDASGHEEDGPDISPASWGGAALSALMRAEMPPEVPCLRVVRGPLAACWAAGGAEGSRAFLELFEKFAGEGDLLGLLPSTGRGTNALCEVLATHLLQSAALLPCVETLASLQGSSPLMALHISRAYARRGQLEAALSALLRCLHAYPEEACLLRQLAELLLRGGLHALAARAAAYAVELCPTVARYWLTLARAEIACGRWGDALLALNASPDVAVSFPLYLPGLPADIESYPVTQPRQQGVGYYSSLWLTPVKPTLVPFKGNPSAVAATAATPTALRPFAALKSRRNSGGQGTSISAVSSASSPTSSPCLDGCGRAAATAGSGGLSPSRRGLDRQSSAAAAAGGHHQEDTEKQIWVEGRPFLHRGFGRAFGLARELDEERVICGHALRIQCEKTADGRGSLAEIEAFGRRCSSSNTAEHLEALQNAGALRLDLSERRRYSVLVCLYKRIGLRGINALRGALFLPLSTCDLSAQRAAEANTARGPASPLGSQENDNGTLEASPAALPSLSALEALKGTDAGDIETPSDLNSTQAPSAAFASTASRCIPPSSPLSAHNTDVLSPPMASSLTGCSLSDPLPVGGPGGPLSPVGDPGGPSAAPSSPAGSRMERSSTACEGHAGDSAENAVLATDGLNHKEGPQDRPLHAPQLSGMGPLGPPTAGGGSLQDVLQPLPVDGWLDPSVVSALCSRFAPRPLAPSLEGILADLEADVSLARLTTTKLSWVDLSCRDDDDATQLHSSCEEAPAELGAYWLYRGALCERLHEWAEMEAAYRMTITQGVAPLALRGLLRLYVRLGLALEALRTAHVAAQQLSTLCGVHDLPFLPAWLTTQLTRLVQSEGMEKVLLAAASVPHVERHPLVDQLIETHRSQLQAEA